MFTLFRDILGIFTILCFVVGIILILRKSRRLPKGESDKPRCAHCHYHLVQMRTTICPECGNDVQVTGVIQAGARKGIGVWFFIIFSAVCFFIAFAIFKWCPLELHELKASCEITRTPTASVSWFKEARIKSRVHALTFSSDPSSAEKSIHSILEVELAASTITLELRGKPDEFRMTGNPSWQPFDRSKIFGQFSTLGVDINTFNGQLDNLVASASNPSADYYAITSGIPQTTGSRSYSSSNDVIELGRFALPFVAMFWTAGILQHLRRRKVTVHGEAARAMVQATSI